MKPVKAVGIQYAALPWRQAGRRLEILLITSRETRRWVIPKGWPMKGLAPHEAAAVEAIEEAGVEGEIQAGPLGSYRYLKRIKDNHTIPIQVIVFPLHVLSQGDQWKEKGERQLRWRPRGLRQGDSGSYPRCAHQQTHCRVARRAYHRDLKPRNARRRLGCDTRRHHRAAARRRADSASCPL